MDPKQLQEQIESLGLSGVNASQIFDGCSNLSQSNKTALAKLLAGLVMGRPVATVSRFERPSVNYGFILFLRNTERNKILFCVGKRAGQTREGASHEDAGGYTGIKVGFDRGLTRTLSDGTTRPWSDAEIALSCVQSALNMGLCQIRRGQSSLTLTSNLEQARWSDYVHVDDVFANAAQYTVNFSIEYAGEERVNKSILFPVEIMNSENLINWFKPTKEIESLQWMDIEEITDLVQSGKWGMFPHDLKYFERVQSLASVGRLNTPVLNVQKA